MGKLNIEESSSTRAGSSSMNFKRKPVIIIVVGMAGKTLWCTSSVYLKKKICALSDLNDFMFFGTHEALIEFIYILLLFQGVEKRHFFTVWFVIHKRRIFGDMY